MLRRTLQTAAHLSHSHPPSAINRTIASSSSSSIVKPPSRPYSSRMDSSLSPLQGLYKPNNLKGLYYGPDVVQKHLLSALPSATSKAFIITGTSLATKTPLIKGLEELLGSKHHAGTFSNIREHAPIAQLDEATEIVKKDSSVDTIISVGGGSPIDSAKAIVYRVNEATSTDGDASSGKWLLHIAIPTTLSAAECTAAAGYTRADGVKTGIAHPATFPQHIFYDSKFGLYTPPHLFLSTGFRALDHAVESQYHPSATWVPCRLTALTAISELFRLLPAYSADSKNEDLITGLFLAAYASLAFAGLNFRPPIGLSHQLGYALGSPYGIPHGITSCLTLGHVVKLKARQSAANASDVAAILPYIGGKRSGDDVKDSDVVGDKILGLAKELGLKTTLTEKGVEKSELDIICARATGGLTPQKEMSSQEEALLKSVRGLVEGLW